MKVDPCGSDVNVLLLGTYLGPQSRVSGQQLTDHVLKF